MRRKREYQKFHLTALVGMMLLTGMLIWNGCGKENMNQNQKELSQTATQEEMSGVTGEKSTEGEAKESDITEIMSEKEAPVGGRRTLLNLLLTAKMPLGHTMYVWGGGWNEEDTAAGEEARSIGESPRWREFAEQQNSEYNYENTRYQIHDGLDCSGYVGWVIYNVFEQTDGEEGYVMKASQMAEDFAGRGWGTYTLAEKVTDYRPGDIMSMKGHVWISLGMCADGSVVLLHASPPGVILNGTLLEDGSRSQAVELAEHYMQTYYPEWYERYPNCTREYTYLSSSGQMRWNEETLADEEGIGNMTAEEVLQRLFRKIL